MMQTQISPNQVFAQLMNGSREKTRKWKLPAELPYFDGHFPEGAVLPAVGIVDASVCVIRAIMDVSDLQLFEVPSAKFTQVIGPGDEVSIEAREDKPGEWTVDWRGPSAEDKPYVTLRLKVGRA